MHTARSNFRVTFLLLLLLTAVNINCPESILAQTPDADNPAQFSATWQLLGHHVEGDSALYAAIKLTNHSDQTLGNTGWSFFFNRYPSHILPESVQGNVNLDRISGGFFRITPRENFTPLKKGDTVTILYGSHHPMVKATDGPTGGYIIFEGSTEAVDTPIQQLMPAVDVVTLTGNQNWVTSAEERYQANEVIANAAIDVCPITPTPVSFEPSDGVYELKQDTKIRCSQSLSALANRLKSELPGLGNGDIILSEDTDRGPLDRSIDIYLDENAASESYELSVSPEGITMRGDEAGVFYATRSLISLMRTTGDVNEIPCCKIKDSPRFGYRGFHIDIARNFHSKENLLQILRHMSSYKLNKLHLHLCDDEGWRLEIAGLPELTEIGGRRGHTTDESDRLYPAYGSGPEIVENSAGSGFYSREDFIEILKFATQRHIEVIPEIDFPGHARAAIIAMKRRHDRLKKAGDEAGANEFLLSDPADQSQYWSIQYYNDNVVCAAQPGVFRFFGKVVDEMLEMYQSAGAKLSIVHTGGDEVPGGVWEKSPMCQKYIQEHDDVNNVADLTYVFLIKLAEVLEQRDLQLAGWEEIALKAGSHQGQKEKQPNPDFADRNFIAYIWNSVVGWKGEELGYKLANVGYPVVLCNADHLYLSLASEIDPDEAGYYWAGLVPMRTVFEFTPMDIYKTARTERNGTPVDRAQRFANSTKLTEAGRKNVMGIQGQIWSESLRNETLLKDRLYPKLLPLAQRAWSPQPAWAKTDDIAKLDAGIETAFAKFSNRVDAYELDRLTQDKIGYHLPEPGVMQSNGKVYANVQFPRSLTVRYSRDGSQPNIKSPAYDAPIDATPGKYRFATFSPDGRSSGGVTIEVQTQHASE